mgnify:FL=1
MTAHLLTGARLLAVAPVAVAFARPGILHPLLVADLILLAIVTDLLDGKVARRQGTASASGMLFDHVTDCLFVSAGLAGAALAARVPVLLPALIVVAFSQYVFDSYVLDRRKQLRMSAIGRWNGVFYFVPLCGVALVDLANLVPIPLAATALESATLLVAYSLIASTLVSIIDRATASAR